MRSVALSRSLAPIFLRAISMFYCCLDCRRSCLLFAKCKGSSFPSISARICVRTASAQPTFSSISLPLLRPRARASRARQTRLAMKVFCIRRIDNWRSHPRRIFQKFIAIKRLAPIVIRRSEIDLCILQFPFLFAYVKEIHKSMIKRVIVRFSGALTICHRLIVIIFRFANFYFIYSSIS